MKATTKLAIGAGAGAVAAGMIYAATRPRGPKLVGKIKLKIPGKPPAWGVWATNGLGKKVFVKPSTSGPPVELVVSLIKRGSLIGPAPDLPPFADPPGSKIAERAALLSQAKLTAGDPQMPTLLKKAICWHLLWRMLALGTHVVLPGVTRAAGMSQAAELITYALSWELYWSPLILGGDGFPTASTPVGTGGKSDYSHRSIIMLDRYRRIVTRVPALKIRVKYANIMIAKLNAIGKAKGVPCMSGFFGPNQKATHAALLQGDMAKGGMWGWWGITEECANKQTAMAIASRVVLAYQKLGVLSIDALKYVGFTWTDMQAGIENTADAFASGS